MFQKMLMHTLQMSLHSEGSPSSRGGSDHKAHGTYIWVVFLRKRNLIEVNTIQKTMCVAL